MNRSLSTLKVKFILYVVLGLVMLQFYTLWYFFG